jgi:hypothetical protein
MGRWLFRSLILFLIVTTLLGGIILAGWWSLEQIRGRDRYLLAMQDIDCPVPPGMARAEFLEEVQYHSQLPDRLSLVEEDLGTKLAQAFQRHPWVSQVKEVRIKPPRLVQVHLTFRQPVLAVRVGDSLRTVDGQGILLPRKAPTEGLPIYPRPVPPPLGPEGTPWGDPGVETHARTLQK